MTKDVLVTVSGLQFAQGEQGEEIEVTTSGNYYKKNNKHYVLYEEVMEGFHAVTKNVIKFDDEMFNLTKKGATNVNMLFEQNKRNVTNYVTPYGAFLVGVDARKIDVEEEEGNIHVSIDYSLDVNYEHLADCKINLHIVSKNQEGFSVMN